jgi:hypothetical protein
MSDNSSLQISVKGTEMSSQFSPQFAQTENTSGGKLTEINSFGGRELERYNIKTNLEAQN